MSSPSSAGVTVPVEVRASLDHIRKMTSTPRDTGGSKEEVCTPKCDRCMPPSAFAEGRRLQYASAAAAMPSATFSAAAGRALFEGLEGAHDSMMLERHLLNNSSSELHIASIRSVCAYGFAPFCRCERSHGMRANRGDMHVVG